VIRRLALAGVAVAMLSACGPAVAQRQFQQPTCVVQNDSLGLLAQAVPTASLLPCIDQFPVGWSFNSNDVRSGRGSFWMDSDRAGFKALEVTLTEACPTRGTEIPSDELGMRLFVQIESVQPRYVGTRSYVAPGECITYRFDFPREGATIMSTDASMAIGMLRRSVLVDLARKLGYDL
jgi:hypothetical protein